MLIYLFLILTNFLFVQTDYDKGQDRYIDTYITADTALSKQDSEDIRTLKIENAKLETKVNILMGVAGVLGGSLVTLLVGLFRKKIGLGIIIFLLLAGIGLFIKTDQAYCQNCAQFFCRSVYDCNRIGCLNCDNQRGRMSSFRCY